MSLIRLNTIGISKMIIHFLKLCLIVYFLSMINAQALYGETTRKIIYASGRWVPYSYIDDSGEPQGVYIDLLKEIFEKQLKLQVEYQEYPWKRAQEYVKDGLADFFITVVSEERLQYTLKTKLPVMEMYLHVFTYTDHAQLSKIRTIGSGADILDLGLIPVTNLGNAWHKNNIDRLGVNTHYVPNEENAFLFLSAKRADITIEPLIAGNHLIKKLGLASIIIPTEARFGPLKFHLFVSKKSKYVKIMNEIDHVISGLHRSGKINRILEPYQTMR